MINNDIEQFISSLFSLEIWVVFKVLIVLGLFIYLLFSLVIIRQVDLMTGVLSGKLNPELKIVALVHFVFALIVLISAIIIL